MSWLDIGLAVLSFVASSGLAAFGWKWAIAARIANLLIEEYETSPYIKNDDRKDQKARIQRRATRAGVEPALNARVKAVTK